MKTFYGISDYLTPGLEVEYSESTTPSDWCAQRELPYELFERDSSINWWERTKYELRFQVFEHLGEQIFSGSPICITGKYVELNGYTGMGILPCKIIQLRVQLQKVQTMNIIMPKWEPVEVYQGHKVEVKVLCAACGNVWIQSGRGACSSCGSPANWSIK